MVWHPAGSVPRRWQLELESNAVAAGVVTVVTAFDATGAVA